MKTGIGLWGCFVVLTLAGHMEILFAEPAAGVVAEVIPEAEQVLPLIPLHFWVQVHNTSTQDVVVTISLPPLVEYGPSESGPWSSYVPFGSSQPTPTPPARRTIRAGDSLRWSHILDINMGGENIDRGVPILQNTNTSVYLRTHIAGRQSLPVQIRIMAPSGEDEAAWRFLRDRYSLVGCFSEHVLQLENYRSVDNLAACRDFEARFHGTTYGAYARLGLALVETKSADAERRKKATEELQTLGKSGPKQLRARALWYAANFVGLDTGEGQRLLVSGKTEGADSFFAVKINNAIQHR